MSQPMWKPQKAYCDRPPSGKNKTLAIESILVECKQPKTRRETVRWEELIGHK